ncbi:tyrosine-type recombinase/integrase [Hyphomonas adhaerens]|nr:site-specific integrase [Hyphomonas adhaerens]
MPKKSGTAGETGRPESGPVRERWRRRRRANANLSPSQDEIDLETRTWSLPGDRMKSGRDHRVPLSPAAMAILKEARRLDPHQGEIVFPSRQTNTQLSDMTLSAVPKRIDLNVTVHGFRSTFRDWSEEATSFPHEVKEAALAHVVKNKAEAAYRRTDLFEKRRKLMDEWGRYILQTP